MDIPGDKETNTDKTTNPKDHAQQDKAPKDPEPEKIDTDGLEQAATMDISLKNLNLDLNVSDPKKIPDKDAHHDILEEMAEDMLHLIEASAKMESRVGQILAAVSQVSQNQQNFHREQMVEAGKLKKELVSERKALIARSTFNAILPAIESLTLNCKALDYDEDIRLISQMTVVTDMLKNVIQSLGYFSFGVVPGTLFDPASMECIGYDDGDASKVIRVERMGYKTENALIKPCGVILGK